MDIYAWHYIVSVIEANRRGLYQKERFKQPRHEHPIDQYLPLLIAGDRRGLRKLFAHEPWVDDPQFGEIRGEEAFAHFVTAIHSWLAQGQARIEHVALTQ